MLDQIRPGDIIVVWKLDRLARSTRDLLNTMDTINEAGGKFQSISEPWANTTRHAGRFDPDGHNRVHRRAATKRLNRFCRLRARTRKAPVDPPKLQDKGQLTIIFQESLVLRDCGAKG